MITPKQRKYLKSLAQHLQPKIIIGKNSLTDTVFKQIDDTLKANELVKIKILSNNLDDHDEIVQEVLETLSAEFVSHLGSKFVIYRQSKEKLIEFPKL